MYIAFLDKLEVEGNYLFLFGALSFGILFFRSVFHKVTVEKEVRSTILFNAYKKELFTTNNGYKSLQKRLRSNWKIQR
jgi:hypothetical protein